MFETFSKDFDVKAGGTFDPLLVFSMDLTDWTVRFVVGPDTVVLTDGHGLALTPGAEQSTVQLDMTPEQTRQLVNDRHYYLELTDPIGKVGFPLAGTLKVTSP